MTIVRGTARRCTALLASILVPVMLHAQEPKECGENEQTTWWERREPLIRPRTAAERAPMDANMRAAEALVRQTAYGTPRGFAVRPAWIYGDQQNPNQLRTYAYATVIFHRCSPYDEHGSDLTVVFNPYPQSWSEGDRPIPDEGGDGLYVERPRTETLFGSTLTFGHFELMNTEGLFVLFTTGGESPTRPVTREEYLRAQIFTLEGKNQEKVKAVLEYASKTQYQRWLEDAPQRRNRNEEIIKGAAIGGGAAAAEQARADLERAERLAEETLKKEEPQERLELEKAKANATAAGDRLRAQIAAMTPAQRSAPAFVIGFDFVAPGTPDATAIVRLNPDFYRVRKSPLDVRAILVRIPNAYTDMKAQHEQMYRDFDWEALKRLLAK